MTVILNMDSLEVDNTFNQTIFEYYDSYFQEYKQLFGIHLQKYRQEFIDYIYHNAQHLAIGIVLYIVFSICFYSFVMRTKILRHIGTIKHCKRVLFVISHPDDECMFFGPTIVSLTSKPDVHVYLMCLSRGDYKSLGRIRKEELFQSCKILGIPEANIAIINSTLLPDNPTVTWSQEAVAGLILNFVEVYSIDTVITFDRYGVSNHPNHVSVFYGIAYLCLEKKLPKKCTAYVLESVSIIRKYIAYMDLPLTFLLSSKKFAVPMNQRKVIRKAMKAHKSQYVWYRKAYMLTSRYIFVNSFKEVDVLELELEFEVDEERG